MSSRSSITRSNSKRGVDAPSGGSYFSDLYSNNNPCPYENGKGRKSNNRNATQAVLRWTKPACFLIAGTFVFVWCMMGYNNEASRDNEYFRSNSSSSSNIRRTKSSSKSQHLSLLHPNEAKHDKLHFFFHGPPEDGPPEDLYVAGSRDYYTPVPEYAVKKGWTDLSDTHIIRAFQHEGWDISDKKKEISAGQAHIMYQHQGTNKGFTSGQPWQRYSRVPGGRAFGSKHLFFDGMRKLQQKVFGDHEDHDDHHHHHKKHYKKKHHNTEHKRDPIYFIPETYKLDEEEGRDAFNAVLKQDQSTGKHRPWVLKKVRLNNGAGIEMIAPNSPALYSAVDRSMADEEMDYVIQAYICNELTWFGGEKFDLRFYWMIASVDPLIVLYHDGYARVSGAIYDETNFDSTAQHLTNHEYRTGNIEDVLADALYRRIAEHYEQNKARLSKIIVGNDPVQHVRNQMKEAISATAAAFVDAFTLNGPTNRTVTTENLFALYGSDFVIDADLDVYMLEAQVSPGLGSSYDFRIDLFRSLFRPMINIVEEIANKQTADAKANILPLETLDGWEVVYAKGQGEKNTWRYEFEGYERSKTKKGCSLASSSKKQFQEDGKPKYRLESKEVKSSDDTERASTDSDSRDER